MFPIITRSTCHFEILVPREISPIDLAVRESRIVANSQGVFHHERNRVGSLKPHEASVRSGPAAGVLISGVISRHPAPG
jgi:hypothetical protein